LLEGSSSFTARWRLTPTSSPASEAREGDPGAASPAHSAGISIGHAASRHALCHPWIPFPSASPRPGMTSAVHRRWRRGRRTAIRCLIAHHEPGASTGGDHALAASAGDPGAASGKRGARGEPWRRYRVTARTVAAVSTGDVIVLISTNTFWTSFRGAFAT
jgi:hypothetical protein